MNDLNLKDENPLAQQVREQKEAMSKAHDIFNRVKKQTEQWMDIQDELDARVLTQLRDISTKVDEECTEFRTRKFPGKRSLTWNRLLTMGFGWFKFWHPRAVSARGQIGSMKLRLRLRNMSARAILFWLILVSAGMAWLVMK